MAYNPPIGSMYQIYTTYILPSGGLYNPYHPLQEPEKTIEPGVFLFDLGATYVVFQGSGRSNEGHWPIFWGVKVVVFSWEPKDPPPNFPPRPPTPRNKALIRPY